MKKFLKWTAIVLLALVLIVAIVAFFLAGKLDRMRAKEYTIEPAPLQIPSDSASLARGEYWAKVMCTECHGTDYSGTEFFNEPSMGWIHALNLTSGKGGLGKDYADTDWLRAIRHGVRKTGKGVMIMPSDYLGKMDDTDLACLIAYIKTVPPVDKEWNEPHFEFFTKVLGGAGAFGTLYSAEVIDHENMKNMKAPAEGATVEYGEYLLNIVGCRSCHGENLNGKMPSDPVSPFAPNITPGGNLGNWTSEQFLQTMRTGVKPDGSTMDPKFMPWLGVSKLTDESLQAIYLYLQSQPKLETTPHKEKKPKGA
jgi:cytochrome c553